MKLKFRFFMLFIPLLFVGIFLTGLFLVAEFNLFPSALVRGVKPDPTKFPRISATRPLGSPASETDSASVKRARRHPLWPTGGWYSQVAVVDENRTRPLVENILKWHDSVIAGYVRFPTNGYLRIRVYDDYFGSVYGGWSPHSEYLKSSDSFQFVALGTGGWGDGGLDEVREVVWFEEGKKEGVIVFSTAHEAPPPKAGQPTLGPSDFYRTEELGNQWNYNERLAESVIEDYLAKGKIREAEAVIDRSFEVLQSQREGVEGATGKTIPNRVAHKEEWAHLILYRMGLQIGTPEFRQTFKEFESVLAERDFSRSFDCEYYKKVVALYRWVGSPELDRNALAEIEKEPVLDKSVNPGEIAHFIQADHDPRLNQSPAYNQLTWYGGFPFWAGIRAKARGADEEALRFFQQVLSRPAHAGKFEFTVAAVLSNQLTAKKQ